MRRQWAMKLGYQDMTGDEMGDGLVQRTASVRGNLNESNG
jgi:hypothetical protein